MRVLKTREKTHVDLNARADDVMYLHHEEEKKFFKLSNRNCFGHAHEVKNIEN